jgi:hypothetical protein
MSLFDDPVEWSGQIVQSPIRLISYGVIFAATIAMVVYMASEGGWKSAIGLGVFLVLNQFLILYAMRRMYVKLISQAQPFGAAPLAEGIKSNMKKALSVANDVVLCWLPFAATTYLCTIPFERADPGMRYWEPAFYSFLPMGFFFVGAVAFLGRREIRELRTKLNGLRSDLPVQHGEASNVH